MSIQTFTLNHCWDTSTRSVPRFFGDPELGFEIIELQQGQSQGVQLVTLYGGDKAVVVCPTRGMGIWQARRDEIFFGWRSPVSGPIHPRWVPLDEPSGLGWLSGFDELLVRCGLQNNGAPEFLPNGQLKWPLHGRIANLPATEVVIDIDSSEQTVTISGMVHESRFLCYNWALRSTIKLSLNRPEIEIEDRVENLSDREGTFQLLYHCNFGPPVLEAGSKFIAAQREVVPRDERAREGSEQWDSYREPAAEYAEQVYFLKLAANELGESTALLVNRNEDLGAYVRYQSQTLPYFTLWKNTAGLRDGYVTGLEPGTNYPNQRSVEEQAGRVVSVPAGQQVTFQLTIGMLIDAASVTKAKEGIERL